jgi:hypothetical protein
VRTAQPDVGAREAREGLGLIALAEGAHGGVVGPRFVGRGGVRCARGGSHGRDP